MTDSTNLLVDLPEFDPGQYVPLIQPYRSDLIINENFSLSFTNPKPNRWYRFWYRVLLGWKWVSREPSEEESNAPK